MASDATLTARHHWRIAGWGAAALLLALPFVAMRFTSEVNWDTADFFVFGMMLLAVGGALEFLLRRGGNGLYRGGAVVMVLASFLLIWVNLAVGILGDEGNPANLMFAGVVAVAIGGAAVARFRAAGMALAALATAAAQMMVGATALAGGWASPGVRGLNEVVFGTGLFLALWLLSAGLFHLAARR